MVACYQLIIVAMVMRCYGAPISRRAQEKSKETIELSPDLDALKELFDDPFELYDNETVLLYKSDAVYQVKVPQTAIEASEVLMNTESPFDLDRLEIGSAKRLSLEQFIDLFGITADAQLVFDDWDIDGDGFLDHHELVQEKIKEKNKKSKF